MRYRRSDATGTSYFFTANLQNRNSTLLIDNIQILRECFTLVKRRHPFTIEAIVILPEHIHTIWTLPWGDNRYPMRWGLIKSSFSRRLDLTDTITSSRISKREREIWQRRYWEHLITDQHDMNKHIDYIHFNPVKHGYVNQASDWPYSSIHKFIRAGIMQQEWAADVGEVSGDI